MSLLTKMQDIDVSHETDTSWVEGAIKKFPPSNKFHLYFAGSHSKISSRALACGGAHRLCSQLLDRKAISEWIVSIKEGEAQGRLMIDSGAHTAFYTGEDIDVDEYVEYLNTIDEYVDLYVQVDKVPGSAKEGRVLQDFEDAPKRDWENYLYMREKVKSPEKLMPVFHIGEDYKWLSNMLEWKGPNGERVGYIGIAPRQEDPWSHKIKFIDRCFDVIKKSSNPNVKTHALGMTKLSVLESYPFTSADSTSWIRTAAMGSIMTPIGTVAISSKAPPTSKHYLALPKEGRKVIDEYVGKFGLTPEILMEDYNARAVLNIYYLLEWARNYKYSPSSVKIKKLF